MRVLTVVENNLIRERLMELLENDRGIVPIRRAVCPLCVEKAVADLHPDAVLLDVHVRDTEVPERLSHLRRLAPDLRIIALADCSCEFFRAQCLSAGADAFLDTALEFDRIPLALARQSAAKA